jgi:hypothetical protein
VQSKLDSFPQSRQNALTVAASTSIPLKVLQNLYNYVTSFASNSIPPQAVPSGFGTSTTSLTNQSWIPVKAFEDWYLNVQRKVKLDPNYFQRNAE